MISKLLWKDQRYDIVSARLGELPDPSWFNIKTNKTSQQGPHDGMVFIIGKDERLRVRDISGTVLKGMGASLPQVHCMKRWT